MPLDCRAATYMYGEECQVLVIMDERHMRSYRGPRHPSVIGHRPSVPLPVPAFSRLAFSC